MQPTLHFDPKQNYDCLQCGRGCRAGWDIPVEPEVMQRLEGHALTLRVIQERGAAFRIEEDQAFIQNSKDCKECGFLEADQLCGIHRELGFEAKPATCKMFPFVVTQTPSGLFVGTTYYCSAVRQNHGRPCSDHAEDLKVLLKDSAPLNQVADDGLAIHNRYYMNWSQYQQFERQLRTLIGEEGQQDALALAVLGVAQLMTDFPMLEEGAVAIGEHLASCWQRAQLERGLPLLEQLVRQQICDYLKFTLERPLWDQVESALWEGTPMELPPFQWKGTLQELDELRKQKAGSRWNQHIERYLDHLLFRQALVVQPLLLASLCQLHMLADFLTTWTALLAHQKGHPESLEEDYFEALAHCETYLVTHGRNRRIVNELAAEGLVEQLRK